ncbi:MAG TPA: HEAT repeat domain-containing protein, partial [Longimicrobiales bacterium]|nr:HEAT repeat domain-containing protein [Longimicrobiales bacterium]
MRRTEGTSREARKRARRIVTIVLAALSAWAGGLAARGSPALAGVAPSAPEAAGGLQAAPGDSIYREARDALNRGRVQRAAALFREVRQDHPDSPYAGDAHYFEAFALYRRGGEEDLRRALQLLDEQAERYATAPTLADARNLRVRIRGALARRGDVDAYSDVEAQAREECGPDQETRLMALSALQNMNPERAAPILREVLESRDECSAELRKRAVFLVSQKMTDGSVEILLDLAHRNPDPDREVREAAVFWLSQVRSEEALDALVSILRSSDDPGIQEKALFALSQHQGERAGQVLREYAARPDAPDELREQAIFWLGQSPGGAGYLRSLYDRLEGREL